MEPTDKTLSGLEELHKAVEEHMYRESLKKSEAFREVGVGSPALGVRENPWNVTTRLMPRDGSVGKAGEIPVWPFDNTVGVRWVDAVTETTPSSERVEELEKALAEKMEENRLLRLENKELKAVNEGLEKAVIELGTINNKGE